MLLLLGGEEEVVAGEEDTVAGEELVLVAVVEGEELGEELGDDIVGNR